MTQHDAWLAWCGAERGAGRRHGCAQVLLEPVPGRRSCSGGAKHTTPNTWLLAIFTSFHLASCLHFRFEAQLATEHETHQPLDTYCWTLLRD